MYSGKWKLQIRDENVNYENCIDSLDENCDGIVKWKTACRD